MLTTAQLRKIKCAVQRGLQAFALPEPLRLSEWAERHFYLSTESSYVEGPWEAFPYQVGIMDVISNDDIRMVIWPKAARVGNTKIMLAAIGYFAEHKRRNQGIWQPSDGDATDFVKTEVDPVIRDVPALQAIFPAWNSSKSPANTQELKKFTGSSLYIRGGKSAKNYRRLTLDVVYADELDEFDHDIERSGSPVSLMWKRTEGAAFRKGIFGSTPKVRGESKIEDLADEADLRLLFRVPCPECDHHQPLRWRQMVWDDISDDEIHHQCEACKAKWTWSDYIEVSPRGRWESDDEVVLTPGASFVKSGESVLPPRSVAMCGLWTAYSPMTTWSEIKREWRGAQKSVELLKQFTNETLGESWEEQGEQIESAAIISRREDYAAEVPSEACVLTAGVDIQADRIEAYVIGWAEGEESWFVDMLPLFGPTDHGEVWDLLDQALSATYRHESGAQLPISCTFVDSGYRADYVYAFCHGKSRRWIFPIKGVEGDRPIIGRPSRVHISGGSRRVSMYPIGVDSAKALIHDRLQQASPQGGPAPGYIHVPRGHALFGDEFAEQLTAEKLVRKYRRGFPYTEWQKTRPRNEALDCAVYALAAFKLRNPRFDQLRSAFGDGRDGRRVGIDSVVVQRRKSTYL